ncbi:hypothetical protein F4779DRAFT_232923 [Xylariaceae sp. FL0662B]|nr:hypothetical protein F4779DRAFT_232923 [Xylariaceae sp. FL0662B]
MLSTRLIVALGWAMVFSIVAATVPATDAIVHVRNVPGTSTGDTLRAIRRSLMNIRAEKRDTVFKNSTNLDKSWDSATLLDIQAQANTEKGNVGLSAGINITCTTCYIKGNATTQFTVGGDFNVSQAFQNFTDDVGNEVKNLTDTAIDYVEDYFSGVVEKFDDGIDLDDFDFPTLNLDFNVPVPDIPECRLQFQFDGLELYMMLDTVLSAGATYKLNLYSSNSPIGISASSDLFVGVIFSVDLILSIDAEIDISSGIHIKLEDGVGIDIPMLAQNVSNISFNGGQFEFLPVTVESAGGVLKAVLRLGIHAGFQLETPVVIIPNAGLTTNASAGVEVGVYADIAEFATNMTAAPAGDDDDCAVRVQQSYQLGLGAAAGATLAIGIETWGPAPSTQIPIFYTTFLDVCAKSVARTATTTASTASITARADGDLETTTLTKDVVYTGTACLSTGLVDCPVSLQTTTKATSTLTHITAIPAGSDATFPETTGTGVASPVPFGTNAVALAATTGSPVSYVPPPPTASGAAGVSAEHPLGTVGGVDKRVIIGVSVGIGVPVIAGIIAAFYFCQKRRQYSPVSRSPNEPQYLGAPQPYQGATGSKKNHITGS